MLESPTDSCLNKVEWSEVIKLGEEVSKQATVGACAFMYYSMHRLVSEYNLARNAI